MFRRLFYSFLLAVVTVGIWIKWKIYLGDVRIGLAGTTGGFLQLAYLLALLALACLILRALLRGGGSRSLPSPKVAEPAREASLASMRHRIQREARGAFVRQPAMTSALVAVLAAVLGAISIVLLALGRAGGIKSFETGDWLAVVVAELPIVVVVVTTVAGLLSDHESSR